MRRQFDDSLGAYSMNPGSLWDTANNANAAKALAEGSGNWNEAGSMRDAAFWGAPLNQIQVSLADLLRQRLAREEMDLRENIAGGQRAIEHAKLRQNAALKNRELDLGTQKMHGDWASKAGEVAATTQASLGASQNKMQSEFAKFLLGEKRADSRAQMQADRTLESAKIQADARKYGADQNLFGRMMSSQGEKDMKLPSADMVMLTQAALQKNPAYAKLPPETLLAMSMEFLQSMQRPSMQRSSSAQGSQGGVSPGPAAQTPVTPVEPSEPTPVDVSIANWLKKRYPNVQNVPNSYTDIMEMMGGY